MFKKTFNFLKSGFKLTYRRLAHLLSKFKITFSKPQLTTAKAIALVLFLAFYGLTISFVVNVIEAQGACSTQLTCSGTTLTDLAIDNDLTVSGASTNFRNAVKAVDGSGSGIDADLLDGQDGSYYLDNSDTQNLGTSGNTITLTSGGSVTAPYATSAGSAGSVPLSGITHGLGYEHLGAWGVGRTDNNTVLVNTAYRADYATNADNSSACNRDGTCEVSALNATGNVNAASYSGGGCDIAERYETSQDSENLEPGDIVIIDSEEEMKIKKSNKAYSSLVIGVISTKPNMVMGVIEGTEDHPPVALLGRVPTKVSTENGVIKIGDYIVSSSKAGYGMKCDDFSKCQGAIIGKALQRLEQGEGVIEVLIDKM